MKATTKMFNILGAKKIGEYKGRKIYRYKYKNYVESRGVINEKLGTGETLSARYMVRIDGGHFFNLGKREVKVLFPHIKWEFFQKYVDHRGVIPRKSFFERAKTLIIGE